MPDITPETDAPAGRLAVTAFQTHAAAVYRFIRRRIARPQDADDLAQEVFIRFLRIDKTKLVSKPLSYLYGIAAHVVHEFRMHHEREHDHVIYDSPTVDSAAETSSQLQQDDLADRIGLQQQLERALEELPPAQRAVLLLVKRDGLSHREAAQIAKLNVRTVERYVMQAMTRLRMMSWNR